MNLRLALLGSGVDDPGGDWGDGVPAAVRTGLDVGPGLVSVIGDRLGGNAEGEDTWAGLGQLVKIISSEYGSASGDAMS